MKNNRKAFSLVEMSIVLVISGFVMVSFLQILPQIMAIGKNINNTRKMRNISDALEAYIVKYHKLPQPTNIELSTEDSCFASSSGECLNKSDVILNDNVYIGGIPSMDLNINVADMFDGYGNKFVYMVNKKCTENIFDCDTDNAKLLSIDFYDYQTNGFAYVVISNGRDKLNAVSKSGTITKRNNSIKNTYGYFMNHDSNIIYERYNDDKFVYGNADILKTKLLININCSKPEVEEVKNMIYKYCDKEGITEMEVNNILNANNFYYGWGDVLKTYTTTDENSEIQKKCIIQCGQYGKLHVFNYITNIKINNPEPEENN